MPSLILPIGPSLGGVTTWAVDLALLLTQAHHEAILLTHSPIAGRPSLVIPQALRVLPCPGPPAWFATTDDMVSYLPFYNSVLPTTFIPTWSENTYATCALLSLTKADVMRVVGFAHTDEEAYYDWLEYYEPIIHCFVAVSQEIATKLHARIPHRVKDIVVRPYFVRTTTVRRQTPDADRPGPIRLTYAGRLQEEQKRISDLVRLIRLLRGTGINFCFRIIGDGPRRAWLETQLVRERGNNTDDVRIEGPFPHHRMGIVWENTDVAILVSEYEGTSIAMLESMACGCVPLVTKVSGTAALIEDGITGFAVPIGDVVAMRDAVVFLAKNPSERERIGRNARARAQECCSPEEYLAWFQRLERAVWDLPPRSWTIARPLMRNVRMHTCSTCIQRIRRLLGRLLRIHDKP